MKYEKKSTGKSILYTYLFFIPCIQFHVAHIQTKLCWSCPHYIIAEQACCRDWGHQWIWHRSANQYIKTSSIQYLQSDLLNLRQIPWSTVQTISLHIFHLVFNGSNTALDKCRHFRRFSLTHICQMTAKNRLIWKKLRSGTYTPVTKSLSFHRYSLKFSIPQWLSCLYLSLFLTMFPKLQRLFKSLTKGWEWLMKWEWHGRKQMQLISKNSSFVWRDWGEP